MIGRVEKNILICIGIAVLILLLVLIYQGTRAQTQSQTYNISVLVREPSERLRKGFEKAALDYNVDLHLIETFELEDGPQQETYFLRELENNADAIVIMPENPDQMQAFLSALNMRTTIVTIGEEQQHTDIVAHVGIDDWKLGEWLGRFVADRAPDAPCLVVCEADPMLPSLLERMQGLYHVLQTQGMQCEVLYCNREEIADHLQGRAPQTLVALDEALLLALAEQSREGDMVFGAGFSGAARTHLEDGRIEGLVVYSEYDMGYLSLLAAVEALQHNNGNRAFEETILGLYYVDAATMYAPPAEQILFPIS